MVIDRKADNIMSCWRYFYRMQICNVVDLEHKLNVIKIKYNQAGNGSEKEKKRYEKKINDLQKKYDHAADVLDIIESLEKRRIMDEYKIKPYKVRNISTDDYETREEIEFLGTGYSFKQNENSLYGSFSDLLKNGERIESH